MDCNHTPGFHELFEEVSFLELESKTNLAQFERISLHCQVLENQISELNAKNTSILADCEAMHEFKIKSENLEDSFNSLKAELASVEEALKHDISTLKSEVFNFFF